MGWIQQYPLGYHTWSTYILICLCCINIAIFYVTLSYCIYVVSVDHAESKCYITYAWIRSQPKKHVHHEFGTYGCDLSCAPTRLHALSICWWNWFTWYSNAHYGGYWCKHNVVWTRDSDANWVPILRGCGTCGSLYHRTWRKGFKRRSVFFLVGVNYNK